MYERRQLNNHISSTENDFRFLWIPVFDDILISWISGTALFRVFFFFTFENLRPLNISNISNQTRYLWVIIIGPLRYRVNSKTPSRDIRIVRRVADSPNAVNVKGVVGRGYMRNENRSTAMYGSCELTGIKIKSP